MAGLPHPRPWEIRQGELYYDQGWYFERMFEGTVKLRLQWGTNQGTVMIPVADWERIVRHVAGTAMQPPEGDVNGSREV